MPRSLRNWPPRPIELTVAAAFDPVAFLAKVGEGTAVSKYQKHQIVFSQGEVADAVFYIQKGKIKLSVVSERGKEAVVGLLGPGHFLAKGVSMGIRYVSQQPQRLMNGVTRRLGGRGTHLGEGLRKVVTSSPIYFDACSRTCGRYGRPAMSLFRRSRLISRRRRCGRQARSPAIAIYQ